MGFLGAGGQQRQVDCGLEWSGACSYSSILIDFNLIFGLEMPVEIIKYVNNSQIASSDLMVKVDDVAVAHQKKATR